MWRGREGEADMDWFEGSSIALNGVEYMTGFPAFVLTSLMAGCMLYGFTELVSSAFILLARLVRRISL